MLRARTSAKKGFTLLELVIVVVIIGIIAAIAIPRMSKGSAGAADSALAGDLAVLRSAIDLFAAEHDGKYPTLAKIADQLTQYTDGTITSATGTVRDSTHPYGPYVRAIPSIPVGPNKGAATFTGTAPPGTDATAAWYYNETTGEIKANLKDTEVDIAKVPYSAY